jgi:hypothetical protein
MRPGSSRAGRACMAASCAAAAASRRSAAPARVAALAAARSLLGRGRRFRSQLRLQLLGARLHARAPPPLLAGKRARSPAGAHVGRSRPHARALQGRVWPLRRGTRLAAPCGLHAVSAAAARTAYTGPQPSSCPARPFSLGTHAYAPTWPL